MTGYEFMQGQFQDIGWLTQQVDELYTTKITGKGGPTKLKATQDKVIALRKWEPSLMYMRKNLDLVFSEESLFYVPKQLAPGPCIVFPQRDIYGQFARARVKPLYELKLKDSIAKYAALGMKSTEFAGPGWLGNHPAMLQRIIDSRRVIVVEGPFDHLAARLVAPNAPILSSGTKTLGQMHIEYLKILGVRNLHLLFDNERKEVDGKERGAIQSMHYMSKTIKGMEIEILHCPLQDPSKCLESYLDAKKLGSLLEEFN